MTIIIFCWILSLKPGWNPNLQCTDIFAIPFFKGLCLYLNIIVQYNGSSDWSRQSRGRVTKTSCRVSRGINIIFNPFRSLGCFFFWAYVVKNKIKSIVFKSFKSSYIRKRIQLNMRQTYKIIGINKHRKSDIHDVFA